MSRIAAIVPAPRRFDLATADGRYPIVAFALVEGAPDLAVIVLADGWPHVAGREAGRVVPRERASRARTAASRATGPTAADRATRRREQALSLLRDRPAGVAKADLIDVMTGKRANRYATLRELVQSGVAIEYVDRKRTYAKLAGDSEPRAASPS